MIPAMRLGQLITGVTFLTKSGRDIGWHAPASFWQCFSGLPLVNHGWSLGDPNAIARNCAVFIYILIAPTLSAFAVGLLAPDWSDSASNDLALRFARVRRPFTAVMSADVPAMRMPLAAGRRSSRRIRGRRPW